MDRLGLETLPVAVSEAGADAHNEIGALPGCPAVLTLDVVGGGGAVSRLVLVSSIPQPLHCGWWKCTLEPAAVTRTCWHLLYMRLRRRLLTPLRA